jgi:hypothetical protein
MWASALLIAACSPKYVTTETVTIRETQTVRDTITLRDSVTLINDRVQVEIVRLPGDRIFVKGTCKGDTIRMQTHTIKEVEKGATKRQERAAMGVIAMLAITLLAVVLKSR